MINSSKILATHQKLMQKFLLTVILGIFLITSLVISPLPAEAYVSKSVDASSSSLIDVNELYCQISEDIADARTRDACVKAIREDAFSGVRQLRNVMVFNLSQNYSKNLRGSTFKQFRCARTRYGLWIFTSGKFINKGDGGYINWAFDAGLFHSENALECF